MVEIFLFSHVGLIIKQVINIREARQIFEIKLLMVGS